MSHGKQLRLFLPDGTPFGPRYYELVNGTGQAVVMPVSRFKESLSGSRPEFERPGVYLVRGETEEGHATETPDKGYGQQREEMIEQGVLNPEPDGHYLFTVDTAFSSRSATASIV